jgi:hypothetical protein
MYPVILTVQSNLQPSFLGVIIYSVGDNGAEIIANQTTLLVRILFLRCQ